MVKSVLQSLLTDVCDPVLGAAGFARRGRTYRRWTASGDCLLAEIGVLSRVRDDPVRFVVARGVATAGSVDWYTRGRPTPVEPGLTEVLRAGDVVPDAGCWSSEVGTPSSYRVWSIGSDRPACAGRLATALQRDVVDFLAEHADRTVLLSRLRSAPSPFRTFSVDQLAELLVTIDVAPHDELEAVIASIRTDAGIGRSVVRWARGYLAARRDAGR